MKCDLIIRDGTLIDGTGTASFSGDIAISGQEIVAIGDLSTTDHRAVKEIDASGLYVTPGFIDVNSHSAYTLLVDPRAVSALYQGVTLEVVGNCGHGCFPIGEPRLAEHSIYGFNKMLPLDWKSGADYLSRLEMSCVGINVATLVPNGQLRTVVLGFENRPADKRDIRRMQYHLEEGLEAGAIGYSTGLEYPAEAGVSEEELLALCDTLRKYEGVFASHVRERDEHAVAGVQEVIRIAKAADVRLQISHLLPRAGPEKCSECVAEVERAHNEGMPIGFDMHTRTFGTTYLKALLPPELAGLRPNDLKRKLAEKSVRDDVRAHRSIIGALGDWDRVILFNQPYQPEYARKSLAEIARCRGQEVYDAACDMIVQECEADDGSTLMVIMPSYEPDHLYALQKHSLCVPASNGTTMGVDGPLAGTAFHGTFTWAAFYFHCMVRDRQLLTPEQAVHHLTGLPASFMNIKDRGVLRVGAKADIAVFNPNEFRETGTLYDPSKLATGMKHVLVNGTVSLKDGELTGSQGGTVVRH